MGLKLVKIAVTVAAGASTGTATASPMPTGYVEEVFLDYAQTGSATNVVITENAQGQAILSVSNNQTDGAYYPRAIAVGVANGSFGSSGAVPIAVCNPLTVAVSGANVASPAVTAYVKLRGL